MHWGYTKEETLLKKSAGEFLKKKELLEFARGLENHETGFSEQMWTEMANLDWMGILIPEQFDGLDMGFSNLAIILEEMGKYCYSGPFFSTVVLGSKIIADLGSTEQKKRYLPKIAEGKLKLAFALYEENASYDLDDIGATIHNDEGIYRINGKKMFVTDAHIADYILLVGKRPDKNNALNIIMVDPKSSGVNVRQLHHIANKKIYQIYFENAETQEENLVGDGICARSYLEQFLQYAAVAKCCEMVGGMKRALELSLEHAKIRKQFDSVIGTFQAIAHHCANMRVDVDCAEIVTNEAVWRIDKGLEFAKEASMAKTFVNDAYNRMVFIGTQIHGGSGIIDESDISQYLKLAKTSELEYGDSAFHRNRMCNDLGFRV